MSPAPLSKRVERFNATERWYHWVQAVPFLVCLVSGAYLILANRVSELARAEWVEDVHLVFGVSMAIGIAVVSLAGRRESLLRNVRCAFTWTRDDLRWLAVYPLHELGLSVDVPPVGRFNAGQKINLIAQTLLVPTFIVTGLLMWQFPGVLAPWLVHTAAFAIGAPLVLGHLYLALVHPSTRPGLRGVFDGTVSREWAREHYPAWLADREGAESAERVPVDEAPEAACRPEGSVGAT